jgi:hypothetical protein
MNKLKYYILAIVVSFASSCGEDLAKLNVDPDDSLNANPENTLTSGMGYYASVLEAYFNENDAVLAQYWAGGPGVALIDIERYFLEPGDFNTEWAFSYQQALSDLQYTIKNGNKSRAAVAQVMSVLIYQNLVDHFGDVPYSEALKGEISDGSIVTPKYDDSKAIYDDLVLRLDVAIDDLADVNNTDVLGGEDIVYGGDRTKWIRFANSLKLRLLMRQSITDASVGTQVKSLIANGIFIQDESQMAKIDFDGSVGNYNPQYARRESGVKQFYNASETTVTYMSRIGDPRLEVLYNPAKSTGTVVGMIQGNVNNLVSPSKDDFSYPSSVEYAINNPVIFMSHWEVMFLRAEAAARFGTADNDVSMFQNAIRAHFDYIGAEGADDYINDEAAAPYNASSSIAEKSRLIGIQKWISMNGLQESEGWIESRRFDVPGAKIFTDNTTGIFVTPTQSVLGQGVFPSIRLYPQSELDYNKNNTPKDRKLTDKVFWDN